MIADLVMWGWVSVAIVGVMIVMALADKWSNRKNPDDGEGHP